MENTIAASRVRQTWLARAASAWFAVAMLGQLAFVAFILAYYGPRTLAGDYAAWNDKALIQGYTEGDGIGNVMFIAHVLLAAVITLGGLVQLVPWVRQRAAAVHRWNGRAFMSIAMFLAIGGLWLVWVRGTRFGVAAALPTSVNAVLILVFTTAAWRHARSRNVLAHRRFALRAFMVVSGVWFLRIGIMGWIILNQGPAGMNRTMSGPADLAISWGSYLIPLAVLELYFFAERRRTPPITAVAVAVLMVATLFTAVGVFGTTTLMWWNDLKA